MKYRTAYCVTAAWIMAALAWLAFSARWTWGGWMCTGAVFLIAGGYTAAEWGTLSRRTSRWWWHQRLLTRRVRRSARRSLRRPAAIHACLDGIEKETRDKETRDAAGDGAP